MQLPWLVWITRKSRALRPGADCVYSGTLLGWRKVPSRFGTSHARALITMNQSARIVCLVQAVVLQASVACAQEPAPAMKFPSFNSVAARPQGVGPGEAGRPADAVPAPAPGPAAKTATAKPKPKAVKTAALKPSDAAVSKASETKGLSIAVLVNDEPITGYEIEQRQRIMGLGANIGDKAQANFKRMLQDPATSERLKAILGDVIKANQGKTREEVIAIFEERKKQYAVNLQKQAVESAKASVLPGLKKGRSTS